MVPDPVVQTLSGYRVSPCSVNGTLPINTKVIKDSKTLANSDTNTITLTLNEAGNYTCVARSEYGSDVKNFTVVLNGEYFGREKPYFSMPCNSLKCKVWIIYSHVKRGLFKTSGLYQ